ncbi:TPA: hypothetical protein QCW56_001001 [Bacillus cereus]|nr:hypothetical protein [Bacillus cereus]EEL73109.1 hypothetical protein bcere0027_56170 [Bacillus cereus AH676]HDR7202489.1 hypothetical protein [Bacillus cereus]
MLPIEKMNYSNFIEFYVRATGAWLLFSIFIESVKFLWVGYRMQLLWMSV